MNKPPIQKPKRKPPVNTGVRLPPDLHEEIHTSAKLADRSMNAEIITRLRVSPVEARLNDMAAQIAELKAMLRKVLDKI
jgi:hypothetical protein